MTKLTTTRSALGKANKKKGYQAEKKTADEIVKVLGGFSKPTPRSGGIWMSGDVFVKGSELEDWVIEVKSGKQIPKKIIDWANKVRSESQGKKFAIVLRGDYEKPLIGLDLDQFLSLIYELQGYKKEYL